MKPENFLEITNILPEGFLLLSGSGSILAGNAAAHELFRSDHLPGLSFADLVSDSLQKVNQSLNLWSSSRQMMPASFTIRNNDAAGSIRCDGAVIRPAGGASAAVLLLRCLPTSESTASKLFVKLNAEIDSLRKHSMEQKARDDQQIAVLRTAAAVFAHEIANPLNAISTSLQILQQELLETHEQNQLLCEMVESASEEVDRLTSLLNDFRSFARPQSVDFKPTVLSKTVEDALALEMPGFRARDIRVELDFEPIPPLMLDADKMKEAFCNLFKNAMEAMPQGGCLTIRGYVRNPENVVALEFSDTGTGIPAGVDVFQLFVTTKPGRTGLGLPIAAQIIAAHHGQIQCLPGRDLGTTFQIFLPLSRN